MFISFGKNEINDQAFSPIPIQSSDSQKNKLSIISDNKETENYLSPLPMNDLNFPIIKEINNYDSDKNYKEINIVNEKENKWKNMSELLLLNRLKSKNYIDINKIPKMIIIKLIILRNKNKLINQNIINNNTNNNISMDMKNSFDQSTKIEVKSEIKFISDNSLDVIAEDSNIYNIENEDKEEKEYIYEPTNIQNLLNFNFDSIFDIDKLNSMAKRLEKIDKIYNVNENDEFENLDINKDNNNYIYTIKEVADEDIYEQESRNLSMKNNSMKNSLVFSKNKDIKESFNNLKDSNIYKGIEEGKIKEINIFKDKNKEANKEVPDYSEFFKHQPTELDYIEQKLNNKIDENLNNNKEEIKEKLHLETSIKGEINENDINDINLNEKNTFNKLSNEPNYNFSFGIKDLNNNNNNENNKISSSNKNFINSNNKEITNNEIFTFDKNKNIFGKDDFKKEQLINENNNNNNINNANSSNSKKFDKILEILSPSKDDKNNKKIKNNQKENDRNLENRNYKLY